MAAEDEASDPQAMRDEPAQIWEPHDRDDEEA